jgi:HAD superfamily hydrolase (TIGR01509 family)
LPLRAILFDVDGTLAETEEAHRQAFNRAFAEARLGWQWTRAVYAQLLTTTGGRERIARFMDDSALPPDPQLVAHLHRRKNMLYAQAVAAGLVQPRPGVRALIDHARACGIVLGIATTTSRANLDALLAHAFAADAASWFGAIITGEDVRAKKPDPEAYALALARLDVAAADCVAIEDSAAGLAAARACGIATVVTPSVYTDWHDFSGAALVCDTLHDAGGLTGLAALLAI